MPAETIMLSCGGGSSHGDGESRDETYRTYRTKRIHRTDGTIEAEKGPMDINRRFAKP